MTAHAEQADGVADPGPAGPRLALRELVGADAWLTTTHLLLGLWIGVVAFVPTVVLLSLSVGLLPLFLLGVPLLGVTLWITRLLARLERGRFRLVLGIDIPESQPRRLPGSLIDRLRTRIGSAAGWREVGYLLLRLPLGAVQFGLTIVFWSVPVALLTLPIYNWALPNGGAALGFGITVRSWWSTLLVGVLGLVLLVLAPRLVRWLGLVDVSFARRMLGPSGELAARVGELERSRARVVDAAERERRRIERDLHDGAQQRLVALAMNLGRAKARYDQDPEAARALIDEAHADAKQALAELRDLARGLHPAVLADRGLDAALSALAARSPVPVTVEVEPDGGSAGRPSQVVEAIAYFVVAEALTNVAKHSRASRAAVVVRRLDGLLRVVVTDDGVGGADAARGTGLRGLADRVSGVDGRLFVDSPAGGPTVLTVELPCAS
ncbi:MAG: sensor histidine kinase [Mycobacteriales bacterium]